LDEQRLKDSFARVAAHGDAVALFFYSDLFLRHPELRDMFPVSMSVQRDRLLQALGRIVADVASVDDLVPYLQDLGRDHRKFGTIAAHYPAVGVSLLATLAHFSGADWTPELAAEWEAAYGVIASVMSGAAADDEAVNPPWWDARVISYERRTLDIAVFRVEPAEPMRYRPGQSVALQVPQRPRVWRFYSMANAPRVDGTLDFHVGLVDGGQVSSVLTRELVPGSWVRFGPPVGKCTLDTRSGRDIVMVAGGTGLAPLKAIIDQISAQSGASSVPHVHLFTAARAAEDLYDQQDLDKLAASYEWLTVTPVVHRAGERGSVADAMAQQGALRGSWRDHDAYVCGSSATVEVTVDRLRSLDVPEEQIHVEDFGWSAW
jgi:NAD(P)H-flavin reductase/hemoglobin-like flavoprotein